MKTTLSINISGSLFTIDTDAYKLLNTYLENIESRFKNGDNNNETFEAIEERVAELLTQMGTSTTRVVSITHVREIIKIIGAPEIFGEPTSFSYNRTHLKRQLLRDPRSNILGGVCSGVGAYLGVDTTIIRALIVFISIIGGAGIILYLILWIIVPSAKKENYELLDRMRNSDL